jgi:hypothetical protein
LVKVVDNSTSMNTAREIALDTEGNLFATQFNATIELIPGVDDPMSVADNASIDWYLPLESASFSGIDVALGLPIDLTKEGDYDGNGVLDAADIDLQAVEMKKDPADQDLAKFDHNGDGVIDVGTPDVPGDRLIWIKDLRQTSVGDANLDGVFDSGDLVAVFGEGKYDTGEMATWEQGDWSGDMSFDSSDLVLAFQDGGYVAGGVAAVPEPSGCLLTVLGLLSLVGAARRRR